MCKVYTGYCGTSEIEHGLCACTVDNPRAKARRLSLRTGAQTMLYLSLVGMLTVKRTDLLCYSMKLTFTCTTKAVLAGIRSGHTGISLKSTEIAKSAVYKERNNWSN